jgi:hypothetical protein
MNRPVSLKIIILIFFSFLFCDVSAQIYVKANAVGANNGTSWHNAYTSLKNAITHASSGDQIWVAEGTYYPTTGTSRSSYFHLKNGVEIYGGFPKTGNPTMSDRDYNAHPTIMSGDIGVHGDSTDNSYHVIYNNGTINNTAVLDGFIIEKGYGSSGVGIYLRNASPTIRNCTIRNNYSTSNGAGIYLNGASPVIKNCIITENQTIAANRSGGGIYISGSSNPSITNCTISKNVATYRGGGIYDISTAHTNAISGNTIENNKINSGNARGGGIYLDNSAPNITGNIIQNNIVSSTANNGTGQGAGIYVNGSDISPLISNNTIQNNTATTTGSGSTCGYGAGIYLNQSPATIQNNTIKNNTAKTDGTGSSCGAGGGIYCYRTRNNLISGNTISGNTAIHFGAGIFLYQSDPNISNNTINDNIINSGYDNDGQGAGIMIYDNTSAGTSPTLTNNNFTNNQAKDNGHANAGYGGAIVIRSGVSPVLTSNTFSNNSASQNGGAVYLRDNASNAIFNRNMFNGNNALNGGAFYINNNSTFGMYNNIIHDNSATNGGAIYFNGNDKGKFLNNTIADNSATNGGAFYFNSDADLHLKNSIFWGNSASSAGKTVYLANNNCDPYFQYDDVDGGKTNFAGPGSGGSYTNSHYSNNINSDPQFADALYHLTLGSSPAIGAGDPSTTTGDFPADQDYDANQRIRGVIDQGAYETNNAPEFITSGGADDPGPEKVTMDEDGSPTAFSLTLYAKDIDDDNLAWSIITSPSHGTASVPASTSAPNPQSVSVSYKPDTNYNGSDMFKVQISDGQKTDIIEVDVTINPVNDTPYFTTSPPVLYVKAMQTWTYNIATNDVDDALNTLTLTCTSKPSGMSFTDNGNGTGTLSWKPTDAQVSPPTYTVTLRIKDPHGAYKDQSFDLTVKSRLIYVPADYPTIQQAIDAAVDGQDKIVVSNGTYTENINTKGKTIEIEGNTSNPSKVVIDGGKNGPCITVNQGGSPTISGFKLTNGTGQLGLGSSNTVHAPSSAYYGGGILVMKSSPTFKDMVITNCTLTVNNNNGGSGAGIYIGDNSDVKIEGNDTTFLIKNNIAKTYRGGGICIDNSQLSISHTKFENNYAGNYGGGISAYSSTVDLSYVKFISNKVDGRNGYGGGMFSINSTINKSHVTNSGNTASRAGNNQYLNP